MQKFLGGVLLRYVSNLARLFRYAISGAIQFLLDRAVVGVVYRQSFFVASFCGLGRYAILVVGFVWHGLRGIFLCRVGWHALFGVLLRILLVCAICCNVFPCVACFFWSSVGFFSAVVLVCFALGWRVSLQLAAR